MSDKKTCSCPRGLDGYHHPDCFEVYKANETRSGPPLESVVKGRTDSPAPVHSKLKVRRGGVMWLERLIWPPYYYVQSPYSGKYLHNDGSWGWGTCFKTRREAEAAINIARQESI